MSLRETQTTIRSQPNHRPTHLTKLMLPPTIEIPFSHIHRLSQKISLFFFFLMIRPPPSSPLFPSPPLFRSIVLVQPLVRRHGDTEVCRDDRCRLGRLRLSAGGDYRRCVRRKPDREKCCAFAPGFREPPRSEEHTSELQSQSNLVCRLLLEKK